MERTIKVTGFENINVKPDQIELNIREFGLKQTYESAFNELNLEKNKLDDILSDLDLNPKILKTRDFNITKEYESYRVGDEYKRRFKGYEYRHDMIVKIDLDYNLLFRFLKKIDSINGVEVNIRYTVKDKEDVKNKLLAKAIKDAENKAKVLTSTIDVALGSVINIDYSFKEIDIYSDYLKRDMVDSCAKLTNYMEVEPEDIEINDRVTVVYEMHVN